MANANQISLIKEPIRTLRKIQTVRPGAIIAGGYHRDLLNDVHFSDVDILVPRLQANEATVFDTCRTSDWENLFKLQINNWRSMDMIQELDEDDAGDYGESASENIRTAFGLIKNEINYNLIIVENDPIDFVMDDFDFNICKTYCDGKKVTFTKEFMADIEQKHLTFAARDVNLEQFARAMQVHLPKLKAKYPDYKVVVDPSHEKIHNQFKKNY